MHTEQSVANALKRQMHAHSHMKPTPTNSHSSLLSHHVLQPAIDAASMASGRAYRAHTCMNSKLWGGG